MPAVAPCIWTHHIAKALNGFGKVTFRRKIFWTCVLSICVACSGGGLAGFSWRTHGLASHVLVVATSLVDLLTLLDFVIVLRSPLFIYLNRDRHSSSSCLPLPALKEESLEPSLVDWIQRLKVRLTPRQTSTLGQRVIFFLFVVAASQPQGEDLIVQQPV